MLFAFLPWFGEGWKHGSKSPDAKGDAVERSEAVDGGAPRLVEHQGGEPFVGLAVVLLVHGVPVGTFEHAESVLGACYVAPECHEGVLVGDLGRDPLDLARFTVTAFPGTGVISVRCATSSPMCSPRRWPALVELLAKMSANNGAS